MSAKRSLIVAITAIVCVASLLTCGNKQEVPQAPKKTDSLKELPQAPKQPDELLQALASEAVDGARLYNHVNLDYTIGSLKLVDAILMQAHEAYLKDADSVPVSGLSATYGAYVGEVIRRNEERVEWRRDGPPLGQMSYPLVWGQAGLHAYPLEWCRQRILIGDKASIWKGYTYAKEMASHRVL